MRVSVTSTGESQYKATEKRVLLAATSLLRHLGSSQQEKICFCQLHVETAWSPRECPSVELGREGERVSLNSGLDHREACVSLPAMHSLLCVGWQSLPPC